MNLLKSDQFALLFLILSVCFPTIKEMTDTAEGKNVRDMTSLQVSLRSLSLTLTLKLGEAGF